MYTVSTLIDVTVPPSAAPQIVLTVSEYHRLNRPNCCARI